MFAYCLNNPINYIDTQGLRSTDIKEVTLGDGTETNNNLSSSNPNKNPPDHPDYKPPKKGPRKKKEPNGPKNGWEDINGDVWVWDNNMHGGPGWVVQEPDGDHWHAYPGGGVRKHCEACHEYDYIEIFPSDQSMAQITSIPANGFAGGCAILVILMIAFDQFGNNMRGFM